MEKMGLNKFTHIALLKNDAQKVTKKKKEQSLKFIKKIKIMYPTKNHV